MESNDIEIVYRPVCQLAVNAKVMRPGGMCFIPASRSRKCMNQIKRRRPRHSNVHPFGDRGTDYLNLVDIDLIRIKKKLPWCVLNLNVFHIKYNMYTSISIDD